MTKITIYVGVDVSKKTLDIAIPQPDGIYKHIKTSNDIVGFSKAVSQLPSLCCIVMEATSSYYMPFAYFLHQHNFYVSVVNPLTVNHFCKMRMSRAKTDRKDAAMIAEYGKSEAPRLWIPKADYLIALQQMDGIINNLTSHRTSIINQKEAYQCSGKMSEDVLEMLDRQLAFIESEISIIEDKMLRLGEQHHTELLHNLRTIPSVGKRTALKLLIITDGFTKFSTAKELVSYVGLCPRLFESGSSIKGKAKICKMGMSRMRQLLYLCALSAIKVNCQCKAMYERLKVRGKNGKLALVAVASKILRQAFAIGKGNVQYAQNLSF